MKSLNKVSLIGHLGKDPEIRSTQGGKNVVNFSLATSEGYANKQTGEDTSRTEWHSIIAWEKLADIVGSYLKKGSLVYVEGRIQSREYEDKQGVKRKAFEIVAREIIMLDSRKDAAQSQPATAYPAATDPNEDDIPF